MNSIGDKLFTTVVWIITSIITVAIIAILVSNRSQTPAVLSAGGNAFANILKSAFGGAYSTGNNLLPTITITG